MPIQDVLNLGQKEASNLPDVLRDVLDEKLGFTNVYQA